MSGVIITAGAVNADGIPTEATYRFDVALEDARLRWFWWKDGAWLPFTPPAIGQTILLRPLSKPLGLKELFAPDPVAVKS